MGDKMSNGEIKDIEKTAIDMERKLADAIRKLKDLFKRAKEEAKFMALHKYDAELKEDFLMERDVALVLRDFIYAFRDLILILRDLERVEGAEGPKAQEIHKRFVGTIEHELRTIMREIKTIAHVEKE